MSATVSLHVVVLRQEKMLITMGVPGYGPEGISNHQCTKLETQAWHSVKQILILLVVVVYAHDRDVEAFKSWRPKDSERDDKKACSKFPGFAPKQPYGLSR